MKNEKKASDAGTSPAESSLGQYYINPSVNKTLPKIPADVYQALPTFYRSAAVVMHRNGRLIIDGSGNAQGAE